MYASGEEERAQVHGFKTPALSSGFLYGRTPNYSQPKELSEICAGDENLLARAFS